MDYFVKTIEKTLADLGGEDKTNPVNGLIASLCHSEDVVSAEPTQVLKKASKGGKGAKQQHGQGKKAAAAIIEETNAKALASALHEEVLCIRNSKSNLLGVVCQITLPQARGILLVEILSSCFKTLPANKGLLYEAFWALEQVGLPTVSAPPIGRGVILRGVADSKLVCDDLDAAKKLVAKVQKFIRDDPEFVRVQMVDMSQSLPPLGKFEAFSKTSCKWEDWMIRVVSWLEAGDDHAFCACTIQC